MFTVRRYFNNKTGEQRFLLTKAEFEELQKQASGEWG